MKTDIHTKLGEFQRYRIFGLSTKRCYDIFSGTL